MKQILARLSLLTALVLASTAVAGAQTSSISGTVVDSAGGAIPGAPVVVKGEAGFTAEVLTNAEGVFSVPALNPGLYSVTVALSGFKTALLSDLRLSPGTPLSVKVVLEVGNLEETITVQSSSELINTQTATVAATLNVDQINKMPMPSRNALNAVTFLPGINTTGINRDATVNGLPQSFINITLDGVTNNDNFNKTTDGFFAMVTPRQDAIEAVTVTSAAGGSDVGGHGAVAVNFVTRSGSNRFTGSAYEYFRHPDLNSNTWFNNRNGLPKNDIKLNQYGVRQGGPIVIPGLYDGRGKAFFFGNYEELRLPNNFSRTRTVLHPRAQEGFFRYNVGSGANQQTREVNVLALAASRGFLSTPDPTVMRVLGYINSAMTTTGVINANTDPVVQDYVFQSEGNQTEKQPVVRIDYNINDRHRLSGTINQLWVVRDPDQLNSQDVRFPGAPSYRKFVSTRPSKSVTLRSNFGTNLVNELRGGITRGGASYFGHNQIDGQGVSHYQDQGGYHINIDGDGTIGSGLTNWSNSSAAGTWRAAYAYTIDNTLSWQQGKHSWSFGGSAFLGRAWENGQTLVPEITLGFNSTQDPTNSMFVGGTSATATFPDATAGQLTDARALYGLLTGRVLAITGQAALDPKTNKYIPFAPRTRAGKMDEYSFFVQDSWRMTPTLTINGGLRWDLQLPFTPVNDVMSIVSLESVCGQSGLGDGSIYRACDFFNVGKNTGVVPQFEQFTTEKRGYNTDWNNVAPNVGVAWRPNVQTGWLRSLLGDPEQATLRAGYSVAYERQGMAEFTGVYGPNQGSTISLTRSVTAGIIEPGETWPVLLRESHRLYNQPFNENPSFPIVARPNRADSLNAFHPDVEIASARTWTVSFQRSITRDMAAEIRYVGTKGVNQWSELNYNARDFISNGFIDEFRRAQGNLQANNAAGGSRAGSFAYFGPNSGTTPLPVLFAYLVGPGDPNNSALYTGGTNTWTNSTLAQRLVLSNPAPQTLANDLDGTLARRNNALNAGLAANYFVVNPAVAANLVTDSGAFSDFHALQLELRRRLSRGLSANVNYQYALESGSSFQGFQFGRVSNPSATVRHAIKTQWDWELPVGRGKKFGSSMHPVLDGVLGGWTFNGVGRLQARMVNFGNVRLVGMTKDELQKLYKFDLRVNPDTNLMTPYMLPDDIILNTRRAFSVSTTSPTGHSTTLGVPEGRYFAPANGPDCIQFRAGDCAPRTLLIRAPWFSKFDIGVTKKFPLGGRKDIEIRADVLNVFNAVNFNPVANPGTGAGIFQATSAYSDISNTFDPGSRLGQLVFRFNW